MALWHPVHCLSRHFLTAPRAQVAISPAVCLQNYPYLNGMDRRRGLATVVPPVTQDSTSSKGPTAIVFMNMGGPSKTEDVGDFLSRLFVGSTLEEIACFWTDQDWKGRWRPHPFRAITKLPRPSDFAKKDAQNTKAVCSDRRWISN